MSDHSKPFVLEVCVDSVESAIAAQQGGADRVELCDNLVEGGTTPSAGMIEWTRRRINIGLHVIIRPRGGDFCYSDIEFEVMRRDIEVATSLGVNGVVIGLLNRDGSVDCERMRTLSELARPLSVTFHRAFDMTRDPYEALDALIELGVDRVLTSGQESSALEGLDLITDLIQRAGERMIVMPGGGINERNLQKLVAQSGAREVHVTGNISVESAMQFRNERVFMGRAFRPPEFTQMVTNSERIGRLRTAAKS
jgi:copper homeostasis protein